MAVKHTMNAFSKWRSMHKLFALMCTFAAITSAGCNQKPEITKAMQNITTAQPTLNGKKIDIAEWTEEVLLHDGKKIVVWRRATAYAGGFPNASRGRDISMELKYAPMGTTWKHEMSDTSIRRPRSFEIVDGIAYLVLYVGDDSDVFCINKPPSQYLAQFLMWADGRWVDIDQAKFPSERSLLNLSTEYWGQTQKEDAKGLIAWEGKRTGGNDGETVKSYFEEYSRVCALHQKK